MLFTFPSRYWSTIGLTGVFSLAGWSRRIRAGFLVSRLTQDTARLHRASHTGLSPSMATLSSVFRSLDAYHGAVLQPRPRRNGDGLGSSPVARHYWGNHCYFLFLKVLRCFSSLRSPPDFCPDDRASLCRVVPFGNPRIKGHLHLPAACRSLSRPSSPP